MPSKKPNALDHLDGEIPMEELGDVAGGKSTAAAHIFDQDGEWQNPQVGVHGGAEGKSGGANENVAGGAHYAAGAYGHTGKGEIDGGVGVEAEAHGSAVYSHDGATLKATGSVSAAAGAAGEAHTDHADTGASGSAGVDVNATGHAEADTHYGDFKAGAYANGSATEGAAANGSADIQHGHDSYGVAAHGAAMAGDGVSGSVGGETGVHGVGSAGGAVGASAGEVGISGSASAGYSHHQINLALGGDVALGLGLKASMDLHIDTKPFEKAGDSIAHTATSAVHSVEHSGFAHDVEKGASTVGHAVAKVFSGW